jgi:uncharacterized RDD family membrane protein YckC
VAAPDQLTIETPEQITLEFALAGIGSRFLALAIDTLLQAAGFATLGLSLLVAAALASFALPSVGPWVLAVVILAAFLIYYGYFALFESIWAGQTPGKRMVGLRVIAMTGRPATVYQALIRNLLRIVDQLPAIYAVAIVTVMITPRQQRLGDLAAGTVVIHDPSAPQSAVFPTAPPRVQTNHGAARLRPDELAVIESFLRRRTELDPDVRWNTARAIASRVRERLALGAAPPDETLLEEVAAEYRSAQRYRTS